ncbi:hypothetical protein HX870_14195 [Pseudomonas gingeri]|uniref:Uncharacterized protein n=1 Tax=Pseudomonas gingeri TaxID=117681 RepID=A0A7Y7XJS7_9PSED|nr:hypothetical protein [Pseudomonas gingeri]NWC00946.1 hypothetical protein [Pseudomonas gingeri]NWD68750.1 hypothetical protein [Pseudomonas gingeri]NWD77784.1 hypothetical protein [Pseudomonas gingeri]
MSLTVLMILEKLPAHGIRFNFPLNSLSVAQFYLISEVAVLPVPLNIG